MTHGKKNSSNDLLVHGGVVVSRNEEMKLGRYLSLHAPHPSCNGKKRNGNKAQKEN